MIGFYIPAHTEISAFYNGQMVPALLYGMVCNWAEYNEKHGKAIHDGKSWMFRTMRSFSEEISEKYPFVKSTFKTIRYWLNRLVQDGFLLKDNFSIDKFDHTNWYRPAENLLTLIAAKELSSDQKTCCKQTSAKPKRTKMRSQKRQCLKNLNHNKGQFERTRASSDFSEQNFACMKRHKNIKIKINILNTEGGYRSIQIKNANDTSNIKTATNLKNIFRREKCAASQNAQISSQDSKTRKYIFRKTASQNLGCGGGKSTF